MIITRLLLLAALAALLWLALRYIPFYAPAYTFYPAVIVAAVALIALARPIPSVWLASRGIAAAVLLCAAAVAILSLLWPSTHTVVPQPVTLLDRYLPAYDFREFHSVQSQASPEAAWQALETVTFRDVPAFEVLMWLRLAAVGRFRPERAPQGDPILTRMTMPGGGFQLLERRVADEVVIGMVGRPWQSRRIPVLSSPAEFDAYAEPGSVRIAFNLRVRPDGAGCRITTETRIAGTDSDGTRTFGRYWCAVYPGSSITRQAWLQAIARAARR